MVQAMPGPGSFWKRNEKWVLGTISNQGRAKKILVFRSKNKTRARKKNGHRQQFTTLMVDDVLAPGQQPKPKVEAAAPEAEEPAPKRRRGRRSSEPDAATELATAEAGDAPVEAAEKPKRGRRKAE